MSTGYRSLTASEQTLLDNCPECVGAINHATFRYTSPVNAYGQHTSSEEFAQFSCMGMQFMRVIRPGSGAVTYVWNHPGPIQVTGLKGIGRVMKASAAPHWPGLGKNNDLGAYAALPNPQNRAEINAAIDFLAYYDVNGCSKKSLPVVVALQNAYNASGLPGQLTDDGEYGPNTQRALQNIMDEAQADAGAGPSQQAPANCFPEYGNVPSIPALDRPNAAPTSTPGQMTLPVTTITPSESTKPSTATLLVGGAVAAVAGGLGYWYWKKHKRGR